MSNIEMMPLGDILSITQPALVSRDGMDGIYRILNHMTNEDLHTHMLPGAADKCRPNLLEQHPMLADVRFTGNNPSPEDVYSWLETQESLYGATLPVEAL